MIWALVDGEKQEAIPKAEGICPLCEEKVFSKCGDIYVWHWSHYNNKSCDVWHEGETIWHKHWKMTFGKENTEVLIEKNGKKHFADIETKKNVVIELQNSKIEISVIKEREDFYGEQMLWLINGMEFKKNLVPKRYWDDKRYVEYEDNIEALVEFIMGPKITKGVNDEFFKWKYPRKSWKGVNRPVFIDIEEHKVFMVKEGMGTNQIRGTYISKETFIKKYGGDYDYYRKYL